MGRTPSTGISSEDVRVGTGRGSLVGVATVDDMSGNDWADFPLPLGVEGGETIAGDGAVEGRMEFREKEHNSNDSNPARRKVTDSQI